MEELEIEDEPRKLVITVIKSRYVANAPKLKMNFNMNRFDLMRAGERRDDADKLMAIRYSKYTKFFIFYLFGMLLGFFSLWMGIHEVLIGNPAHDVRHVIAFFVLGAILGFGSPFAFIADSGILRDR